MLIRGGLIEGDIHLDFLAPDDLHDLHPSDLERDTDTWCRFLLSEGEARGLLTWLRGSRTAEHHASRFVARGGAGWVLLEGHSPQFAFRIGTPELVAALTRELGLALGLILGHAVPPLSS